MKHKFVFYGIEFEYEHGAWKAEKVIGEYRKCNVLVIVYPSTGLRCIRGRPVTVFNAMVRVVPIQHKRGVRGIGVMHAHTQSALSQDDAIRKALKLIEITAGWDMHLPYAIQGRTT